MTGGGSLAPLQVLVVLLAVALAVGFAFWIYFRREPAVRGRLVLALLRAAALVLLVLLFWNPSIPALFGGDDLQVPGVLLDASLSMTAGPEAGTSPWQEGLEQASDRAGSTGRILLFGSSVRGGDAEAPDEGVPSDGQSLLAPALERAASLGAVSVEVVSDFRLEDPVAVSRVVESTGLSVGSVDVGTVVRNAGVADVTGPRSIPAGEEGTLEVRLAGEGGGEEAEGLQADGESSSADSVTLEIRIGDELAASRRVPLPTAGRTTRHELPFVAPTDEGGYRLRVQATLPGDVFAPDDEWIHYLEVEEGRSGLVVLSLEATWEPRYLIPVMEEVTGLSGRGFVRLDPGRWLSMGRGVDGVGIVEETTVRPLAERAEVLVIQGLAAGSPSWIRELATTATRVVILPRDASVGPLVGVELTEPRAGEWYVSPEIPASPLAADLAGMAVEGLPPLNDHLRLVTALPQSREPLMARQGRQGPLNPVLALLPAEGRRTALVLASGLWRWAARDGMPRESYRRIWSGVAGWLLEEAGEELEPTVEPARRPAPRDEAVAWRVRGVTDSLALRVLAGDSVVQDTTLLGPGTTIRTPSLDPGPYRYEAEASGLPGGVVEGVLEVTAYSDELLRPRIEPPGASAGEGSPLAAGRAGRPLRTHAAPYLLLIALLCAEWIGRRRQGLR